MSVSELHQIDWQAFCYVANELSAEERLAFEESLAIDQVAREALARAVEVTRAVAAAESHEFVASEAAEPVVVKASGNWTRRISWMAVGAAASLLVAVLVSSFGDRQPLFPGLNTDSPQSNRELASAWSETRAEFSPRESAWSHSELSELTDELAGAYAVDSDSESSDTAAAETPSWMTAALLAQAEHSPDDSLDGEQLEN